MRVDCARWAGLGLLLADLAGALLVVLFAADFVSDGVHFSRVLGGLVSLNRAQV